MYLGIWGWDKEKRRAVMLLKRGWKSTGVFALQTNSDWKKLEGEYGLVTYILCITFQQINLAGLDMDVSSKLSLVNGIVNIVT